MVLTVPKQGKRMHERVCQLTRFDWVTLAEVQTFRTREGIDGREMVMNSNGSLERRFRTLAPSEKARLERKYQRQLYTRLNLDDQSLTLLGDDNDSEDAPSDQEDPSGQDDRLIPRRRRPHRRPIDSDNSDDENDYGPGRGGGRIVVHRPIPTLEEYNNWHATMAPTVLNDNNNTTEQILSRFQMGFQEMLQQNSPIAAGVPAPQTGPRPTIRPLLKQKAPPSPGIAPRTRTDLGTGETTTGESRARIPLLRAGPRRTVVDLTTPGGEGQATHGGASNVGTGLPLGTKMPALREADRERSIDPNPTPNLQKTYNEMPQAFISAVMGTTLLSDPMSYYLRVLTLTLLRPAWDAQNERAAEEAARRGKTGKRGAPEVDGRSALEMYTDFFTNGGLNTYAPRPVDLLEVLRYSDATIESDNSFFQFLFPIDSISGYNPPLPPVPADFHRTVSSTPGFSLSLMLGVRRVMRFWGFQFRGTSLTGRPLWRLAPDFVVANHGWTQRVDHNHQRVAHVIRSLRLIRAPRTARSVYRCMTRAIRERGFPVREQTRRLWRRQALGPLDSLLANDFPSDANFRTDSESEEGEQTGGPGLRNLDGSNDDSGGPEGGAGPLLVTDPGTSTLGNQPARPTTQQAGSKRPGGFNDDGSRKRQRPQPAREVPLDPSLSPNWELLEQLRSANRGSGRREDSEDHDSGSEEDLNFAGNYSSSEGFLDPHERDEDFLPRGLGFLPSPVRPYFREAALEYTPPVAVPDRAPVEVRGPYESVPERGAVSAAIGTGRRAVPVVQPQEIQQTVQRYPLLPSLSRCLLREIILSDKA